MILHLLICLDNPGRVQDLHIIVSLPNQSNSYYMLSVAFRSENNDGQQHLEAVVSLQEYLIEFKHDFFFQLHSFLSGSFFLWALEQFSLPDMET